MVKKKMINKKHFFDIDVAKEYGLAQAIIISHLQFWIEKNADDNKNFYDGRYWTFASLETLSKRFPYFTKRQVRYAIETLVDRGVLLKGNFNKKNYDKTTWYAFNDEKKWIQKV